MIQLYNVLSSIAVALYSPWIFLKKGPADKTAFIQQRLGITRYEKTDFWIHAVSVGEVLASLPFLKALKKAFPGQKMILSTTTYTGQEIARERFPEADRIIYMPVDALPCVSRVVRQLQPKVFISVETELWPALITALKKSGSRIIILNGRISKESFKGYKKIRFFMKELLSKIDFLYMQGDDDAERIIELGSDRNQVGVMGNFKFDINMENIVGPEWLDLISGDILLAASTHKGEEELILDAYTEILKMHKGLKLIIAPRHPERFEEVAELIEKKGLLSARRSALKESGMRDKVGIDSYRGAEGLPDIIILDTIGELPRVFSRVTIALIGGSLVPVGGHNILEPAYWSKPIIFGPYMDNFPISKEFIDVSAALEVNDSESIIKTITDLLSNREKAERMGKSAKKIVNQNTGAVQKAIELVRGYFGNS